MLGEEEAAGGELGGGAGAGGRPGGGAATGGRPCGGAGAGGEPGMVLRREKTSDMALPTLIGADGRHALIAFTCLDSLRRWRPDARPVPVPARAVWQAGVAEASAVVIDVAGPVAVAVDGARLAALADDEAVPAPHQDPDLVTLARDLVAREPLLTGFALRPGQAGTDVTVQLKLMHGHTAADANSREAIGRVAAGIMAGAGTRVRRGLTVEASEPAGRVSGGR
jgi:hypothetical protein